ncbi:LysR family transcriptional regulator [Noviherbaspirillum sp. CPCC 100848]|uniref:LysR family transcriptional regulator n=1 Tax=Noviherbaspirillum album TaxID=3080276 RepID=A0ABU6JBK4_9BURK|nr:LysR family transcriptional regulator [Noviherbaspirillum sp. CPCC 100848]MEC4720816.1 LysR family transcriptional regulator [Noviherbaspirillum sp. CPCC 100848]
MSNRLDSRSLALFLAVADTLSFRQAAETLHMSQPPLSRAIRELEERLGMPLFVRNTRGVVLTEDGRRLLPYARRVARLLRDAEAELTAPGLPNAFRLGLTNAVEPAWFDGLVERLQATQPEMAVSVLYDTSPRLVRQLRSGKLDAAFVALPTDVRGLTVLHLDRVPMMVAMHSNHRLARRRTISLADIGSEPVFWFERARQPAFYDHCQQIFTRHGFAPSTLREPNDHHVLLADVARGRGLALLPGSFASLKRAGVVYKKLAEGAELGVGIGLVNPNDQETMRTILVMAANLGDARQQGAKRSAASNERALRTRGSAVRESAENGRASKRSPRLSNAD